MAGVTGLLQGFNNGFQLADNQIRQDEANERYEAGVKKEERRYQDNQAKEAERYQSGVTRQAKLDGMAEIQFNNSQEDRQAKKSALAVKQKRDAYTYNAKQRKDRYNDVMQNIANAFSIDKTGANISQEQLLEWYEQSKGTNAEVMFDIVKQEANQYLVKEMQTGFEGTDNEQLKNVTNTYLSSQINRRLEEGIEDKDGNPIQGMEFSRWQNYGKGGLIAHVNVIKADGTTYEAPISEFRSADDDDPIRVYDSEKLFDHLIAENQLIGVLNKTGYLSKLNAPNLKSSGAKETPEIITNKYAAQIQGVSEAEAWQQTLNKSKNPEKIKIEAFKLAEKSFTNSYGDTLYIAQDGSLVPEGTEGARAPTQQDIYDKANSLIKYSQGASPQQSEQTAPDDLINQAKAAISNGADQRAVIQRLIDKGYTKEQILQQFQ